MLRTKNVNAPIMFLFFLLALLGPVRAEESLRDKEVWVRDKEDFKKLLELPYEKHFDAPTPPIDFSVLDDLRGFYGFEILSWEPPREIQGSEIARSWGLTESASETLPEVYKRPPTLRIRSSDALDFEVSIYQPESCESACDHILNSYTASISMPTSGISSLELNCVPSNDDKGNTYKLFVNRSSLGLWYLDVNHGLLIVVDSNGPRFNEPPNDVLIKQMNAVAEGLVVFLNSEPDKIDKDEEYYKALVATLPDAPKREEVEGIPAGATRFDLLLSEIPSLEQEGSDLSLDMKKPDKLIFDKPYLLSRADGKPFPTVKIADPDKLDGKVEPASERVELDGICDIQVNATASLRADGRYEVRSQRSGKTSFRVLYLDKDGNVVQFGEVEVEVGDAPEGYGTKQWAAEAW